MSAPRVLLTCAVGIENEITGRPFPPLGIGYLASYLGKTGAADPVKLVNRSLDVDWPELIRDFQPDLVGISAVTQEYRTAIRLAQQAKSVRDVPVVVGGYHISALPQTLDPAMDVGVMGEGELPFAALAGALAGGRLDPDALEEIPGIAYRVEGKLVIQPGAARVDPLDDLPFPVRDLSLYRGDKTHLMTTRGCPYSCSYCAAGMVQEKVRSFSPAYVVAEIAHLVEDLGMRDIAIEDDLFTANRRRVLVLSRLIREAGLHRRARFSVLSHVNMMDDEIAEALRAMNVHHVSFGFESGSKRVLQEIKRDSLMRTEDPVGRARSAISTLKKRGITVRGFFIIGAPWETAEDVEETFEFMKSAPLDSARVGVMLPFPGTEMWAQARVRGIVSETMDWDYFDMDFENNYEHYPFVSEQLSRERLREMYREMNDYAVLRERCHTPLKTSAIARRVLQAARDPRRFGDYLRYFRMNRRSPRFRAVPAGLRASPLNGPAALHHGGGNVRRPGAWLGPGGAALVAAAAALRLGACARSFFKDEDFVLQNTVAFLRDHSFIPAHFNYPTLYSYVAALPTALWALLLSAADRLPDAADLRCLVNVESALPALPGRLVSTAAAVATLLVVIALGARLQGRRAGLVAGACLAFSGRHLDYSSLALPDALMTLCAAGSLAFALRALQSSRLRDYAVSGALVGLAAATKYNGALVGLALVAVWIGHAWAARREAGALRPLWGCAAAAAGAAAAAFLVGCPGWVVAPEPFLEAFQFEREHMATGHLGAFGVPYLRHLQLFLQWERSAALLYGLGVLAALWRRESTDLVLLALVVPSFLYIGSWEKKNIYYLLFSFPALALLAGSLAERAVARLPRRAGTWVLVAIFAWPALAGGGDVLRLLRTDNRVTAGQFIEAEVAAGTAVVRDAAYTPRLWSAAERDTLLAGSHGEFYREYFKGRPTYLLIPLLPDPAWLEEVDAEVLVLSSGWFDRFFESPPPPTESSLAAEYRAWRALYETLRSSPEQAGWTRVRIFEGGSGPRILVFRRPPGS